MLTLGLTKKKTLKYNSILISILIIENYKESLETNKSHVSMPENKDKSK